MPSSAHAGNGGSMLLAAFPARARARLHIEEEDHSRKEVVLRSGAHPGSLFFPHRGTVVSLTRSTKTGTTVEIGLVGAEGIVTPHALLSAVSTGADAVIQISGRLSRVRLPLIRHALETDATVRELLLLFEATFLGQVSQHVLCNRVHTIEQRLAKWLLSVRDRMDEDKMELTHEFLSHMLGIRRSGVTVAIGTLEMEGLLMNSRSAVTVTDRAGLEERACECYGVIVAATRPLLERLREANGD